jgi:GNAT superfamily N-acetyltransferase
MIVFYWVATQILGGWTPMQTGYNNGLATPFPFLGPLEIGIWAAFNEELLYRLIGIGLVFWLFRKRWLALLIPGALWAFAHLTYIRDPFYMRGIELTIAAVLIFGVFFWKYGLATTIMGHITINALLGALVLLRSPEPKFFLSGGVVVVVLLIPLMPGAIQWLRQKLAGKPPVPEPEIRPAMEADLTALQMLPCENASWPSLLSDTATPVRVLISGDRLLGVAWGTLDADGSGTISGVYVDPAWRRQYWGTRLTEALGSQLKGMGAQHLSVDLETHQKAESSFWASLGWRPARQTLSPQPWPPKLPSLRELWQRLRG